MGREQARGAARKSLRLYHINAVLTKFMQL